MTAPDRDFIRAMVADDVANGKHGGRVMTRFPPEPNGYLHIGHAKSICLNFGVAAEFGGLCNLRFDDTNPETEDVRYVESIQNDIRWLGFDWDDRLYYASDYFESLYQLAIKLIQDGKAYVDSSTLEEIRAGRGTVTVPGTESPFRNRSVEENLDLFRRMRAGEFPNGAHVLRARIDMAAPNMLMRDPLLYRIRHAHHYRQGDEWPIYPMYDFAHGLSDSLEGVTHSLCSLEFKDNRELYDWLIRETEVKNQPEQTEFARLALDYTVMSKRKLIRLVEEGHVRGWDDPRVPTLAGLRRRGVTPEAIRAFCDLIGVARVDSRVDVAKLEFAIRDDLNLRVPRVMCVLRPLKVVIDNYPEGGEDVLEAPLYPHDVPLEGMRTVPFARDILIERDDFAEDPPKGFRRLAPGREVRLRYGYYITCREVIKDAAGEIVELRCTHDPATRGGQSPDGRKVNSTIHWVPARASLPCEVRLYDRLFTVPDPETDDGNEGGEEGGGDFVRHLNPDALVVLTESRVEPSVAGHPPGSRYQFERQGYFVSDMVDSREGGLVFNRTVTIRDSWSRPASGRDLGRPDRTPKRKVAPTDSTPGPTRSQTEEGRFAAFTALGLADADADTLARNTALGDFFDAVRPHLDSAQLVAHWTVNEVARELGDRPPGQTALTASAFASLIDLVQSGTISRTVAKDVLKELVERGGDPAAIVVDRGLERIDDPDAIARIVRSVLGRFPDKVDAYRSGRTGLLGFFVGEVMRETGGKADARVVQEVVRSTISA